LSAQEEMWAGFSSEDRVRGEAVEGWKMNRKVLISVIQPRKAFNQEKHMFVSSTCLDFEGTTLVKTPLVKKNNKFVQASSCLWLMP